MRVAHALGRQLAHPQGLAARLVGPAMTLANRAPIRLATDALGARPYERVLDAGCGTGDAIRLLAEAGAIVTGVDRSIAMLDQAARRNRSAVARGQVSLHRADFAELPFDDASFDGVLAANVAYFWAEAHAIVAELRRVLRPGGRLVIYVTDADTMRGWAFAGPETHRHWDRDGLSTALAAGGFATGAIDVRAVRLAFGAQGLIARARC